MNKTNVGLPEYCWTVLPSTNELVMIKRGEKGYYPQREDVLPWDADNKDILNERLGVTKGQEQAMVVGSMFGWNVPGADPSRYDEDGRLIRE